MEVPIVENCRHKPHKSIYVFAKHVKMLAARSGVSDDKVRRACNLFPFYESAFRSTMWSQVHEPVTTCHRIWPRSKPQCNLLSNRFITRELLRLAGADLRPTKDPLRKRYAHVWGEICDHLGWKNLLSSN